MDTLELESSSRINPAASDDGIALSVNCSTARGKLSKDTRLPDPSTLANLECTLKQNEKSHSYKVF